MKRWLQLGVLAFLAVLSSAILLRDPEPPPSGAPAPVASHAAAPASGQGEPQAPLAPALSLATLDGKPVDLKAYRGKVVAVNFWATWCGPCRQELPELAKLWSEKHQGCFELLGVAATSDRADTEKLARSIPYPVLFDGDGEAMDAWQVRAIPRTFVVDPEGRVRKVFRGAIGREQLAQAVEPLLPLTCGAGQNG